MNHIVIIYGGGGGIVYGVPDIEKFNIQQIRGDLSQLEDIN